MKISKLTKKTKILFKRNINFKMLNINVFKYNFNFFL